MKVLVSLTKWVIHGAEGEEIGGDGIILTCVTTDTFTFISITLF